MDQRDPDNPVKEYTGVWMPKEVMECQDLAAIDKLTFAEVASFDICYASNEWIARRIGRSVTTASKSISRLIELGFVEACGFNGRFRQIRVVKNCKPCRKRQGRLVKNDKAALSKTTSRDNSIDKSIDIVSKDTKAVQPLAVEPVRTQRSLDIDQAFVIWQDVIGYPLQAGKKERLSVNSILSRKGMDLEKLRLMVRLVAESQSDRYKRFSISSYTDLLYKTNELMAWAREKQAQQQASSNVARI